MQRAYVESEAIQSIGYESESHILEIQFSSGERYQYFSVPKNVFLEFSKAESKGRFFQNYIRNLYFYRRLSSSKV